MKQRKYSRLSKTLSAWMLRLDDWRVRQHFKRVERRLRARDVSHLSPELRQARARHLDTLHAYAARGIFPRNHERPGYAPCFIDPDGRECAVAHLVMQSGHDDAARKIAGVANYAYVPQMRFAELDAWAEGSGFTKEEVALIQPSYVYDPELRALLSQLFSFAMSMSASIWAIQVASVLGVFAATVNATRIRYRRAGTVAPLIGLALGIGLLYLAMGIGRQIQVGNALLYPFRDMQPPMMDYEISLARQAYFGAVDWAVVALVVAALTLAFAFIRLVMTRRMAQRGLSVERLVDVVETT